MYNNNNNKNYAQHICMTTFIQIILTSQNNLIGLI